jgi:hypothetical protein
MIGSIKKEFILEVNLDSDYAILDDYIEGLENKGYTILRANAPVMMYNHQTYSMKSYKNVYDNTKMIASFMVGETTHPETFDTVNRTEETVHSILYGLFANIENILSKNNTNVGVIYKIKIGVVYDIDEREFVLYSLLRGSFE